MVVVGLAAGEKGVAAMEAAVMEVGLVGGEMAGVAMAAAATGAEDWAAAD